MADPNAQWAAFCSLLDIDAANPQNSGSNIAADDAAIKAAVDVVVPAPEPPPVP